MTAPEARSPATGIRARYAIIGTSPPDRKTWAARTGMTLPSARVRTWMTANRFVVARIAATAAGPITTPETMTIRCPDPHSSTDEAVVHFAKSQCRRATEATSPSEKDSRATPGTAAAAHSLEGGQTTHRRRV